MSVRLDPVGGLALTGNAETDAQISQAYEADMQEMVGIMEAAADAHDARLAAANEGTQPSMTGARLCNSGGHAQSPDCPHHSVRTCPHSASENQRVPQLPDIVTHHHHHHHYASQDRSQAAGPGPPQPVSHRSPLSSTSGSSIELRIGTDYVLQFSGHGFTCFSRRALTPFELANPCTCLHRDTRASTRTRSRSRGPASRPSSSMRNDPGSTRRSQPETDPVPDTH